MLKLSKVNAHSNPIKDLSFAIFFFSIRGLPPFLGFFPKIWVLFGASFFICVPLIISSVAIVYVYSSILFSRLGQKKRRLTFGGTLMILFPSCFFF